MTDEEKAEEYKESKRLHCIPKERYVIEAQESRLVEIKQAFLAGLEKEKSNWHKQDVDDIYDVISKDWSVKHFICVMKDKSIIPAIGNCDESCNGEVSVNLFFEYNDDKYYIDDVVWWKEIVLPKEE